MRTIFGRLLSILMPFEYGRIVLFALCLFPALVFGGTTADAPATHASGQKNPYLICEKGKRQSPINISSSHNAHGHHTLEFRYQPMPMSVIHDGHSYKALADDTSKVLLDGHPYTLAQFHAHDPSEHEIDGVDYAMEFHLVHKNAEGRLLVVGVLVNEGGTNAELAQAGAWVEKQIGHRLPQPGEKVSGTYRFNPMSILPKDRSHFYTYDGSLTTVPCTEGVQWVVLHEPIELSAKQLNRFIKAYGPIARDLQPIFDRVIEDQ